MQIEICETCLSEKVAVVEYILVFILATYDDILELEKFSVSLSTVLLKYLFGLNVELY